MPARSGTPPPPGAPLKQNPSPPAPDCTPALCRRKGTAWESDSPGLEFQLHWLLVRWPWERHWALEALVSPFENKKCECLPRAVIVRIRNHTCKMPTIWHVSLKAAMLTITVIVFFSSLN